MPNKYFSKLPIVLIIVVALISITSKNVYADTTAPVTTYVKTPSSPDGKNNWYVTPVVFDLTATDLESGVKEINYRVDSGLWQKVSFTNTLNLAPNPSFETAGSTTSGLEGWEATTVDADTTYSQDTVEYVPNFATSSAKIVSTGSTWHGINNAANFSVSSAYDNMTASVWLKSNAVTNLANFKIYALTEDAFGNQTSQLIAQSGNITGTTAWTKLSVNFTVGLTNVIGVYMDIGLTGPGTLWADAVSISTAALPSTTTFTVGSDSTSHTVEFYSVDFAGNTETHSCSPVKNCVAFKLDLSAPSNWHDSGAVRNIFSPDYLVWVYTNVDDPTSGISTFTDSYMYYTELHPEFGRYSNILTCSSTWRPNTSLFLISPPFVPGVHSAYLVTPPTSLCNNNWRACKIIRFLAEDMAGNKTSKDFCVNGPWIRLRGGAGVRANASIDMLSEGQSDNADGVVEAGGSRVDFFTSTKDWIVKNSIGPQNYNYDELYDMAQGKTTINDGRLRTSSGSYVINGNFTLSSSAIPSGYSTTEFNQVVFVNGNLTIDNDLTISANSTVLFVVKGDTRIAKTVIQVSAGILSDGELSTAYDVVEGDATPTLTLRGLFNAEKFNFQRTLQGTNNSNTPSDDFIYEPKYLVQIKDYFGSYTVRWHNVE